MYNVLGEERGPTVNANPKEIMSNVVPNLSHCTTFSRAVRFWNGLAIVSRILDITIYFRSIRYARVFAMTDTQSNGVNETK